MIGLPSVSDRRKRTSPKLAKTLLWNSQRTGIGWVDGGVGIAFASWDLAQYYETKVNRSGAQRFCDY